MPASRSTSRVKSLHLLLLLSLAMLLCRSIAAPTTSPVYTIGTLAVAGTGCPARSVEAATAPDGTSVSIIFSSFEAATDANHTRVRLACSIAVPLQAQPGRSIGFFKVDFRGYVYVPDVPNASATLSNDYFFAGGQGLKIRRTYERGAEQDILESNSINFQSVIWSPCGGSTTFRINTSIMAAKPVTADGANDDVQLVLDSMDSSVQGSVQIAVASRKCNTLTGEPM
ncbi:hypothetical protein PybrP1_000475 [[Pythium] brassicae (nom. inval.)]|nr:hypothetical protein PybrP1_000475 [[Pythium] brassicae (nom. inval.)]